MSSWDAQTAEWYAKNYGDYPTNVLGINALDLQDNITIVDIGCGTGSALRQAGLKITNGILIGIDPVPRMIEIAEEQTANYTSTNQLEFKVGSAEDIPLEDNTADYVLCFDSIDHWENIDKGLKEIKRVLQENGTIAIVKDNSVPGAKKAIALLLSKLEENGYTLLEKKEISDQKIKFWLILLKPINQ